MTMFKRATKQAKKLVLSFQGASGSGKTYSALNVAKHLCPAGKRIAFVDTENSARLYSDKFDFDVADECFGSFGKLNYHPDVWMNVLREAAKTGQYGVVVLDSLTHMWKGQGGILSILDDRQKAYRAKTGKHADSNAMWKELDPIYAKFMNDLRHLPFHTIFCLRAKQKYDRKTGENGKMTMEKVGIEPEFRDGFEYDVDAQFALDEDHIMVAKKHRLGDYLDGKVFVKPGENVASVLLEWLAANPADSEVPPPPPETVREPEPPAAVKEAVAKDSLYESLAAALSNAASMDELKAAGQRIQAAKKDGLIAPDQVRTLSDAFTARGKSLKVAA